MDKKIIGYWILTVLVAFSIGSGGVMDLIQHKDVVEGMTHLGFPTYACTIIGAWKIAGTVVILAPGLKRLKEWAYAGIVIDLVSASACHAFSGDDVGKIVTPLVITLFAIGSWLLRPAARKLDGALL